MTYAPRQATRPNSWDLSLAKSAARCARVKVHRNGLDARLPIGRYHELVGTQGGAFPAASVQVKYPSGLLGKVGIAGEDPAAMAPGLQRIRTEPAPKRHATDLRHDTAGDNLALELRDRQVRERYAMAGGDLTGQPLNLDDDAGGGSGLGARRGAVRPARRGVRGRTGAATC